MPDKKPVDETGHLKPDESAKERVDRELIELLNEVRVALPGVQVLFAFLLVLPFQQGWSEIDDVARALYFLALGASAAATAVLITPSVYHRLNFRRRNKERMLLDSNQLVIIGTSFVAIGIAAAIFLVADVAYGRNVATLATVVTLGLYGALWWGLPLWRRREPDDDPDQAANA
jgi:hypothetical protein